MLHPACTKQSSNQQPRIRLWFTDFEPISKICCLQRKSTIQKIANELHPSIIVTIDFPTNHVNKRMPVLDLELWIERHRVKQSTLQRYEFHFTSIQRTRSVTYFAVRKTAQQKLPQLKLDPTMYAIGLPLVMTSTKKRVMNLKAKINM